MEAKELTDTTLAQGFAKCEHYDRGYCKNTNDCPKINPNITCEDNCEDKRTCKICHQIPCKNSPKCKWKSCEFSHKTETQDRESFQINNIKNFEERIKANELIVKESHINIIRFLKTTLIV